VRCCSSSYLRATPPRTIWSRATFRLLSPPSLFFFSLQPGGLQLSSQDSRQRPDEMRNSIVLSALLCATTTLAQIPGETLTGTAGNTTIAGSNAGPDKDGKYVIQGVGIRANFISYGASISNLFINDTNGIERDIVGGFDNATYYGVVSTPISERGKGGDCFEEEKLMIVGPPTSSLWWCPRPLRKPDQEQQLRD